MNLSLGEYRALLAKAFRGVGYSWGLAEEAAYSAARLAELGLPSGEMVARLLGHVDGCTMSDLMPDADWCSPGTALCPICLGASIADQGGCDVLSIGPMYEPMLAAPLLARTLTGAAALGYVIEWEGGSCSVAMRAIRRVGRFPRGSVPVTISRDTIDPTVVVTASRVELEDATVDTFAELAHRTYAPASDAGRHSGAGAGPSDDS